jgi:hypothetical protein
LLRVDLLAAEPLQKFGDGRGIWKSGVAAAFDGLGGYLTIAEISTLGLSKSAHRSASGERRDHVAISQSHLV